MIVLTISQILFFSRRYRLILIQFSICFDAIDLDLQFYSCMMILIISRFFPSRHNRLILIQFFVPFWHKPMHHNQSKLLFPFIYSRSIYFISAAFSQSVTTFHLLQQNSKMEKYLIEISFFLFRLVEMFEICSRTSVMATTYCHCSKCSRAKYWYVLFFSNFSCMFLNLNIFFHFEF